MVELGVKGWWGRKQFNEAKVEENREKREAREMKEERERGV